MQAAPSCYGSMVASTSEEVTPSLSRGPMTMSVSRNSSQFIEAPAFFYDMDTDLKELKTALKDVDLLNDSGYRSVMERSSHPFSTSLVFHEDNGFDSEEDATDEHWDGYLTVGGDRIKIRDMSDILATRYAFISGARTSEGLTIVTFPDSRSTLPFEDYSLLVKYLLQVPPLEDSHKGFVIIIDRRSDKWSSVRTVLLQISSFFPGKVCVTFVIKPEGVLQRALEVGYRGAADTCSFKVIQLESSAELRKYIHHQHLTMDVGGLIKYNHLEWVQHRMDIERMKASATAIAASLTEFGKTLRETELPNDADSTARILELQTAEKMAIKEEFKIAVRKGFTLLKSVRQLDKKPTPEQLSPTRLHNVTAIERMLVQLEETERSFDSFWMKHERRLRYCLELRQFEDSFRKLQAAFARHMLYLEEHREVGNCTEKALQLAEQHRQYAEGAMEEVEASRNLKKEGEDLINSTEAEHSGSLEPKCEELERMAAALNSALERRGDCLKRSVIMHDQIAQANSWCSRGAEMLSAGMADFVNPNPSASLPALDAFLEEGDNLNIEFLKDTSSPMNQLLLLTTIETSTLLNLIEQRISDIKRMSLAKKEQLTRMQIQKAPPVQIVTPEKKKKNSQTELDVNAMGPSGSTDEKVTRTDTCTKVYVNRPELEPADSEKCYIENLELVIDCYIKPYDALKEANQIPKALFMKVDALLLSIRKIYDFHSNCLLKEIDRAKSGLEICRVVIKYLPQMYEIYQPFLNLYKYSDWDSIMQEEFIKQCEKMSPNKWKKGIRDDFLIAFQRTMRYQNMMKEIEKKSPEKDRKELQEAISLTSSWVISLMNSLQQIHITGYNGDLKALGDLKLQSDANVYCNNRKKKMKYSRSQQRVIFFFDAAIMFCKRRTNNTGDSEKAAVYEHKFCIPTYSVGYNTSVLPCGKDAFEVFDNSKPDIYICETNEEDRKKWMARLQSAMAGRNNSPPTENRQQRPQSWSSVVSNESSSSNGTRESVELVAEKMDPNGNTENTELPCSSIESSSVNMHRGDELNQEVELVDSC